LSNKEGLWRVSSGKYISYPVSPIDIPQGARLLVECNPKYIKGTKRPKYLFSFVDGEDNFKNGRTRKLLFSREDVQTIIDQVTCDTIKGYHENFVEEYDYLFN